MVLVEVTEELVIDLDDLSRKAKASDARFLLLSNMRGHLCDMDCLMSLATDTGLTVIEDCAHTMGARWAGRKSGSFGLAGCFSTQTYKHMNSGEGGLLTSDDTVFMARAIMLSGSYMLYGRHGAAPGPEVFADIRLDTPNMSARMDNLRAANSGRSWQRWTRSMQGGMSAMTGSLRHWRGIVSFVYPSGQTWKAMSVRRSSTRVPSYTRASTRFCGGVGRAWCRSEVVRCGRPGGLYLDPSFLALCGSGTFAANGQRSGYTL